MEVIKYSLKLVKESLLYTGMTSIFFFIWNAKKPWWKRIFHLYLFIWFEHANIEKFRLRVDLLYFCKHTACTRLQIIEHEFISLKQMSHKLIGFIKKLFRSCTVS